GLASPRGHRWTTPGRPDRPALAAALGTWSATPPFATLAPDGRPSPRGAVVTVLATLGWLPAVALAVVAFLAGGVIAGVPAAAASCRARGRRTAPGVRAERRAGPPAAAPGTRPHPRLRCLESDIRLKPLCLGQQRGATVGHDRSCCETAPTTTCRRPDHRRGLA